MPGGGKKGKQKDGDGVERAHILCPRGTIRPHKDFDEEAAVAQSKKLHRALQKPHDMAAVIRILTKYTLEERKYLEDVYNAQFSPPDLLKTLKQVTGGNFRATLVALFTWQNQYLAGWARTAMRGPGTNKRTLVELFCGRERDEILDVVKTYSRLHGHTLESELRGELSGHFLQLHLALVGLERSGSALDQPESEERVRQLAERLQQAVEQQRPPDAAEVISVLCNNSGALLRRVLQLFPQLSQKQASVEEAVKAAFRGDIRTGLVTIVQCIRDQPAYFAGILYTAMKGLGTDDGTLVRVLVTRAEIDLENIKEAYKRIYGKSLAAAVADDTSGDYRSCLLAIIKSWT